MGIVYEAEELGAVRRRVALKLIKQGFASRASTARIEAERQALAVMSHPAIATVFNAGTTDEGQPYFAMELANGSQLVEYCDSHRLTVRERLELFLEVCRGVQHAHQKGVIHRDLKPSNVLVLEQEGRVQPKIIDFGIAKALGQQLTENTLVTQQGQTLGTAAYMSPEQAGGGQDVDTRADIYSLGVILYELLAGELPVSPSSVGLYVFVTSLAAGQLNPPPPSERVRENTHENKALAYSRRSTPQRLIRELRGDLDTIVMKTIDPDRTCRYETVNALATDVHRYLVSEPILARPPSTSYRVRKFVRRNRTAAIAGGLTAAALLLGSVATTVGMLRAAAAERRAAQEAAAAQQVTSVLVDMFEAPDPYSEYGPDVTAREVLDRGGERIRFQLARQPRLYARVMLAMGKLYGSLALYDRSRELLEDALSVREREFGPVHPEVAETLNELGAVARITGELGAAEAYFRRALSISEGSESSSSILSAALSGLAGVRLRQGRYAESESLYVRARSLESSLGQADPGPILSSMASLYGYQERYAEAEPLMRELLRVEEATYGPDHPRVAEILNNLGAINYMLGRYAEALPLYERARAILERNLGPSDPNLALNLTNIGEALWKLRRYPEAESYFRRSLAIMRRVVAPDAPTVATTLNGLAGLLRDQRRYDEAEPLYREALQVRRRANHPKLSETLEDYAQLLRATGREREAAQLLAGTNRN